MVDDCYKIFLRVLKENGKYELFMKSISNEQVFFLRKRNVNSFISFINVTILDNKTKGNKNASTLWYSLPDLLYKYQKVINEYSKLIAKEFFNSQPLLIYKINYEIYKSSWNKFTSLKESIEECSDIKSLITGLFDWAETEDGIEFWCNIDERLNDYITQRL